MSFSDNHFIDFRGKTAQDIYSFFQRIQGHDQDIPSPLKRMVHACLIFLEPSTRTQLSFELALKDCGVGVSLLQKNFSSFAKGETLLDTLLNLQAMGYDLFVIRKGEEKETLEGLTQQISTPIINAGEGISGHPTQALLDCYTLFKRRKKNLLAGERVLFVGDIRHSRVVKSNIELMRLLNIDVAFCAPDIFLPSSCEIKIFPTLEEGLNWASVVMALRTQFERHDKDLHMEKIRDLFIQNYGLTTKNLRHFAKDGVILHPGPFNRDYEIASDVLSDQRVAIYDQVQNGRLVRRSLVQAILRQKGLL